MDIHVADDEIGRYFRRLQLACRMLAHGARRSPVCRWSGVTRDQLVTLRRRWRFDAKERLRGRSPSSFKDIFSTSRLSYEATLAVLIGQIVGLVPFRPQGASIVSLENGERLCLAYEIFRAWVPDSQLEIEDVELLVRGVAAGVDITLARCTECGFAHLLDSYAKHRKMCLPCERGWGRSARGRKRKNRADAESSLQLEV